MWSWFGSLSADRDSGFGVGFIRSSEYVAWQKLHHVKLFPSEVDVLKAIDRAFVHANNNDGSEPPPRDPERHHSLFQQLKALKESEDAQKGGRS